MNNGGENDVRKARLDALLNALADRSRFPRTPRGRIQVVEIATGELIDREPIDVAEGMLCGSLREASRHELETLPPSSTSRSSDRRVNRSEFSPTGNATDDIVFMTRLAHRLGMELADACCGFLREARGRIFGVDARRYRWPCTFPAIRFVGYVTLDGYAIIIVHDQEANGTMHGNGTLAELRDLSFLPNVEIGLAATHAKLRHRFSLRSQDAVFVVPLLRRDPDINALWCALQDSPHWPSFVMQFLFNLDHHRQILGLKKSPLDGPREPGPRSKEGIALALMRASPGKFVVGPTTATAARLKKELGWPIESAKEARARGAEGAEGAKGYRLVVEEG